MKKDAPASRGRRKGQAVAEVSKQVEEPNPFWDFSLAVYARDGTAPACLALQDTKGVDVNLLLFCCWAGVRGHALNASELETLSEAVKPWRGEILEPLRAVRRQLGKGGAHEGAGAGLLDKLKSAELEAEAVQQRMLFKCLPLEAGEGSEKIAADNLKTYVKMLGVDCDSAVTADLAAVLRGAVPSLAPLEAVWTLV